LIDADGDSSGILALHVAPTKYHTRLIEAVIKASPYGLVASLTSFWFPVEKDPPGLSVICPGRLCDICYARCYGQTIATVPDAPCYSVALEEIYPQQGPRATRSGITGTRTRERARYWQTGKAA